MYIDIAGDQEHTEQTPEHCALMCAGNQEYAEGTPEKCALIFAGDQEHTVGTPEYCALMCAGNQEYAEGTPERCALIFAGDQEHTVGTPEDCALMCAGDQEHTVGTPEHCALMCAGDQEHTVGTPEHCALMCAGNQEHAGGDPEGQEVPAQGGHHAVPYAERRAAGEGEEAGLRPLPLRGDGAAGREEGPGRHGLLPLQLGRPARQLRLLYLPGRRFLLHRQRLRRVQRVASVFASSRRLAVTSV